MLDFLANLLDYFFYKKCYFCKERAEFGLMCSKCLEKIKSKNLKRTKIIKGTQIQGYFTYEGETRQFIRAVKYHNKHALAAPIAKILAEVANLREDIEIVPVPLHDKRKKQRKYNHMELIASHMGFEVNTNIVKRVKDTVAQYNLSEKQRKKNLQGAFRVFPEQYSGKKLILLDDICTTGATMEELINELKKNNIRDVAGLVICFTPLF